MLKQEENPGIEFEYSLPSGSIQETPQGGEGYVWTEGKNKNIFYKSLLSITFTAGQKSPGPKILEIK